MAAVIVVPDEAAEVAVDEGHDNAGVEENEMGEDDLLRSPTPPPFSPITPASPHTSPVSVADQNEVTTRAGRVSRPPDRFIPSPAGSFRTRSEAPMSDRDIIRWQAGKFGIGHCDAAVRRIRRRSVRPEDLARALEELRTRGERNENDEVQANEEVNSSDTDSLFHGLRTPDLR